MQKNVPKKMNQGRRANPVLLAPFDRKTDALQVIIETPKGSRNKYAFDESQGIFLRKRVLPAGMAFPYDFGFVPRTRAEDGDPVDVLVLMDEPAFVGCGSSGSSRASKGGRKSGNAMTESWR